MAEYYCDERPKEKETVEYDTNDGTGNSGGGGGDGGGGGGTGGDTGEGTGVSYGYSSCVTGGTSTPAELVEPWYSLSAEYRTNIPELLMNGQGFMLICGGHLLQSINGCVDLVVECQIQKSDGSHAGCILVAVTPKETSTLGVAGINGLMEIAAKWQSGHYDYESIHTVRFRFQKDDANITPWVKLPMGTKEKPCLYKKICQLRIVNGLIRISTMGL